MRSGVESSEPKELPFRDALQEVKTRTIYIRRMLTLVIESTRIQLVQIFKCCNGGQKHL